MQLADAGFTFLTRRYQEDWKCAGCGVRIIIKSASPYAVARYVQYLIRHHDGFMTDGAVLSRINEAKALAAAGKDPGYTPSRKDNKESRNGSIERGYLFHKVWLKVDFTDWKLRVANRVRQRALKLEQREQRAGRPSLLDHPKKGCGSHE